VCWIAEAFDCLKGHPKYRVVQGGGLEPFDEIHCHLEIGKMDGFQSPKILNVARRNITCYGGGGAGVI
jgi:hypothetical protein